MFKISISNAKVDKFINDEIVEDGSFHKEVDTFKIINKESITRLDVAETVKEILYNDNNIDTDELFDGNENFFTYSRIEDSDSNHVTNLNNNNDKLFYVTYFIDVDEVRQIKTSDLI